MSYGDRAQGIAEREIAAERRLLEFRVATAPVIGRHLLDPLAAEPIGEDAGLHRAVDDDPGAVRGAPGNDVRGRLAMDQGEGRLQRINVANSLSSPEEPHVEIRYATGAHLSFADQA